jgi:Tol biopolymer transport system component
VADRGRSQATARVDHQRHYRRDTRYRRDTTVDTDAGAADRRRGGRRARDLALDAIGRGAPQSPNRPVVFTIEAPNGFNLVGPAASTSVPQLAVAPDGRRLVFVAADAQSQPYLWLRDLDDPIARRLPGTEGATDPFWSPDGRRLGFLSLGVLKTIDAEAKSASQPIGRAPADPRGGAWNVDGEILFYAGRVGAISRILATGGPVTEVTLKGATGTARWPEFLPDGRHVIYHVRDADPERRGAYSSAIDGSESRRLLGTDWAAHYGSGYLLFLDGTSLMAQAFDPVRVELSGTPTQLIREVGGASTGYGSFSVSATGVLAYTNGQFNRSELRWVNRAGTAMDLVAPEGDYVDLSLSPDQSRVGYSRVDPQSQAPDIWIKDLMTGTLSSITSERLVDASPTWSPDGNHIVFRSNRSSTIGMELYRTTASPGGPVERILSLQDTSASDPRTNAIPTSWSRDGQVVFYQATAGAGYGIWATAVDGKDPKPILETRHNELQPALSTDGRWMAYASDQSGQYEIYVQEFPTGTQRTVSIGGGMQPQWRRDGRELFYLAPDGSLMHVSVNAGERFTATAPKVLFKTLIPPVLNPYRMDYVPASDGQRFLMKVPLNREAPVITVILNWPALLER